MKIIKYLLILFVLGTGILIYYNYTFANQTGKFQFGDYTEKIRRFPSQEILGTIESKVDALQKAKKVWKKIYGNNFEEGLNFYECLYDSKEKVWFINGQLKENMVGGVPYIIIRENDGKVLAVWHDK